MNVIANNKKAAFDYFLQEKIEAGIQLVGSEVKSIRSSGISLADCFVKIENDEAYLINAYIKPYDKAAAFLPDSRRNRKLLLHKAQIAKLKKHVTNDGGTIVATKVYISNGKVKIEIATASGKKKYDKRETLKERSVKKEIDSAMKRIAKT